MSIIPWKFDFQFEQAPSLFKNENLPYSVSVYQCSCEDSEPFAIIHHEDDNAYYACPACSNSLFYDANKVRHNSFWYEPLRNLFDENILLSLKPQVNVDEQTKIVYLQIIIDIPESFDLICNKIKYHEKVLYEAIIEPSKPIKQNLYAEYELESLFNVQDYYWIKEDYPSRCKLINRCEILVSFKNALVQRIKKHDEFKYRNEFLECKTLEQAAMLIAFPKLKSCEFFYWEELHLLPSDKDLTIIDALDYVADYRKEKSFKKAVYLHYKKSLNKTNKFNFRYIKNIAHYIKDVNLAIRMIKINLNQHVSRVKYEALNSFFAYLSKYYTEKQLEKLFNEYAISDPYWFIDTVEFFNQFYADDENLSAPLCNIYSIHDGVINSKYYSAILKELSDVTFSYEDKYVNACIIFDAFRFELPQTGIELYNWGETLNNCLSTYYEKIIESESIIYGIFKENTLYAAIEISDNQIIQVSIKHNQSVQKEEKDIIFRWFQQYFSLN